METRLFVRPTLLLPFLQARRPGALAWGCFGFPKPWVGTWRVKIPAPSEDRLCGAQRDLGSSATIPAAFLAGMLWVSSSHIPFFSLFCGKPSTKRSRSSCKTMKRKQTQHQAEQLEPMKDFAGFY